MSERTFQNYSTEQIALGSDSDSHKNHLTPVSACPMCHAIDHDKLSTKALERILTKGKGGIKHLMEIAEGLKAKGYNPAGVNPEENPVRFVMDGLRELGYKLPIPYTEFVAMGYGPSHGLGLSEPCLEAYKKFMCKGNASSAIGKVFDREMKAHPHDNCPPIRIVYS